MSSHDLRESGAAEFDAVLRESLPELPPDEIVRAVTPWRRAVKWVLIGLALNTLTLNFLCLNYILPAIGMVLMVLGFRSLRRENGWFRACYVLTTVRCAYFSAVLILNATLFHTALERPLVSYILIGLTSSLCLAVFFCLWRGIKAVLRKAGLPDRARSAAALIVWEMLLLVLALLPVELILVPILMMVAYIFILRHLFKLSRRLDEAGYAIRTAPVCVPDRVLAAVIAGMLAIGIACGYLFCHSYPMTWREQTASDDPAVESVRAELLEQGFPADVLADLTDADVLACSGAQDVYVEEEDIAFNDGRNISTRSGNTINITTVYDVYELHTTCIAVLLPGEGAHWKLFHHFRWAVDPGSYGTENICIHVAYQRPGFSPEGEPSGILLCDRGGVPYWAPYHSLESGAISTQINQLFGEQASDGIMAGFSLPRDGENKRGYISYGVYTEDPDGIVASIMDYTHQQNFLQYPVMTATDYIKSGGWSGLAFQTRQHFNRQDFMPNADFEPETQSTEEAETAGTLLTVVEK